MKLENLKNIVIMDRFDYDKEVRFKMDLLDENNKLKKRIYKTKNYLYHYESYIPEDDIPDIVAILEGD